MLVKDVHAQCSALKGADVYNSPFIEKNKID